MSFAIHALNPSGPHKATHFSCWEWRPMLTLIGAAFAEKGWPLEQLNAWYFNDEAGLKTAEQCEVLAESLEFQVNTFPDDRIFTFGLNAQSPHYGVRAADVRRFAAFLRECGGFSIN